MRWRLGEGIAVAALALLIALLPYHSAAGQVVLGRWSYPFAILLSVILLVFLGAIAVLMRPPAGPIDGGPAPRGSRGVEMCFDLGLAVWGLGYLIGTIFDPTARPRILIFDLFGSIVPGASLIEWAGGAMLVAGVLLWLWHRLGERAPIGTTVVIVLVALLVLAEGAARWFASFRPAPSELATDASERWDRLYVNMNAAGFRDREHAPFAVPNTSRVLVVGGSDAAGVGIEDTQMRVAEQVASRLEPLTDRHWEPITAAERGAHTPEQIDALRRTITLGPQVVVLLYSFDDIEYLAPVLRPKVPGAGAHDWQGRLAPAAFLYTNSVLFQDVYVRIPALVARLGMGNQVQGDPYRDPAFFQAHLEDLKTLVRTASDSAVVGIVPVDVEGVSDLKRRARYHAFVAAGDSAGLPIWPTDSAFGAYTTDRLILRPDFRHPNAKANEVIADVIATRVQAALATRAAPPPPRAATPGA